MGKTGCPPQGFLDLADRQNCLLLLLGMRERVVAWASRLVFLEEGSELNVYDPIFL